jgi:hypothetical protein
MRFELAIFIRRPPEVVFSFFRDKDKFRQEPGSPVLALEQTTPGPVGVGSRYREVVQMLPWVRGEMLSVVTRFEPGKHLEEDFHGAGMTGHLAYEFRAEGDGTRLIQRETIAPLGLLIVMAPLMRGTLGPRLRARLAAVKKILESGWEPAGQV